MKIVKKSHIRESPASWPLFGTAGQITVFVIRKLIRRGGAPSGAAASIAIGGMGVSTPIIISERIQLSKGNHSGTLTLPGTYKNSDEFG